MIKKFFLLIVACMLLYSCVGCSEKRPESRDTDQVSSEEKAEGQKEFPTIVWQIYDESQELGERFADIWQASLDRLLRERGVPYRVKIEVYYESIKDGKQYSPAQALENFKAEGKQADVISIPTIMTEWDANGKNLYAYFPYREMIQKNLLEPLDSILETEQGVRIKEAITQTELKRSQVNGVTYGIAQHMRTFNAVAYRKDILKKYEIEHEELSADIFENEDLLKKVRDGEEGKVIPYIMDGGVLRRIGVWIIDECEILACSREGSFVNVFETEELKKSLDKLKDFQDQGLINTSDQSSGDFFAIDYYVDTDQIYESVYKVYKDGKGEEEIDIVVVPNEKLPQLALYGADSATGIASWSKHQKEALDFLTLLYTDADIANLIQYGVEGVNYSVENGYAIYGKHNMLSIYGKHFTNPLLTYPGEGMPRDRRAMLEQCYKENEAHMPNGFRFDPEPVQKEIDAIAEIFGSYGEYTEEARQLLSGNVDDPDAALEVFNQKLKAAGADKIVSEANRQLAEWREKYEG
ncbi:ABC transporter substrate-binding protein [Ruminococcus sp. OA3]|uniref:ABC transporter substrate-binding protein n=1 Tax=Ruminococcus sp. OA3 TaxID=2914164 RepID=UPI001F065B5A|nr:ABC transporter substrate-binding protein [Ruminococcus sp. OA3]MCH1982530.1 ABC transporter substrate-binding protein [Ruminococcus sp. OA3]